LFIPNEESSKFWAISLIDSSSSASSDSSVSDTVLIFWTHVLSKHDVDGLFILRVLSCCVIWLSNTVFENAVVKSFWSLRETPSTLKKGLEILVA